MANVNSTIYAQQIAGNPGSPLLPPASLANGKLRHARIEGTVANLGATADTFTLVKLKPGAYVIPGLSKVTCESPGTTVTVSIGDAGSSTRYMASNALGGSARDIFFTASPGGAAYNVYKIVAGNEDVVLTSITIGTPTTTAKIVIDLVWCDE